MRSPTFLPNFLFESNYTYWLIALALAATILYITKSRPHSQQKPVFLSGIILLALTLLWILAATLFQTPQERLRQAHTSLAAAAQSANLDQILSYLAPTFRAPALEITSPKSARDAIDSRLKTYSIKSNTITTYNSTLTNQSAATTLTLLTQLPLGYIKTTWQLDWQDFPDSDWKITRAFLLKINDQPITPDQVIPNSNL